MGIQAGQSDVVIAGGTENISQLPYYIKDARWGARMGHKTYEDGVIEILTWPLDGDQHVHRRRPGHLHVFFQAVDGNTAGGDIAAAACRIESNISASSSTPIYSRLRQPQLFRRLPSQSLNPVSQLLLSRKQ